VASDDAPYSTDVSGVLLLVPCLCLLELQLGGPAAAVHRAGEGNPSSQGRDPRGECAEDTLAMQQSIWTALVAGAA
jgi:hypothetical protein